MYRVYVLFDLDIMFEICFVWFAYWLKKIIINYILLIICFDARCKHIGIKMHKQNVFSITNTWDIYAGKFWMIWFKPMFYAFIL